MQTVIFMVLKFLFTRIFTRELMNDVMDNVEFYMNNNEMSNEEKASIVKENAVAKAKEIGMELTNSSSNLLLEFAVSMVKGRLK